MIRALVLLLLLLLLPMSASGQALQYQVTDPMLAPCVLKIDLSPWNVVYSGAPGVRITEIEVAIKALSSVPSTSCPNVPGVYDAELRTVNGMLLPGLPSLIWTVDSGTAVGPQVRESVLFYIVAAPAKLEVR
jgi:hypothetical protein